MLCYTAGLFQQLSSESKMRNRSLQLAVLLVAALSVANGVAGQSTTPTTVNSSATAATTDVEAAMKQMGFVYKKAMQATDLNSFRQHATEFAQIVSSVQQYQFAADKQQVFMQGLDKVQQQTQQALVAADLASAQQQFAQIDQLRKQYHKERSVSFWQLLFGG